MSKLKANEILLFLSGQPVMIPECNIIITQPTIKQIAALGEEEFLVASQTLSNIQRMVDPIREQGNSELNAYSDFQIFLALALADEEFQRAISVFFELVFPNYVLTINENDIQFALKDNPNSIIGMINPFNFESFAAIVKKLFCVFSDDDDDEDFNPANNRAAEIAEKIKSGKKKIKEIKTKGKEIGSLFGTYTSTLSIGMGISINILMDYTPFQLYDAFTRYWEKFNSDVYQKISTTPLLDASKLDKPEEWHRNLYS